MVVVGLLSSMPALKYSSSVISAASRTRPSISVSFRGSRALLVNVLSFGGFVIFSQYLTNSIAASTLGGIPALSGIVVVMFIFLFVASGLTRRMEPTGVTPCCPLSRAVVLRPGGSSGSR